MRCLGRGEAGQRATQLEQTSYGGPIGASQEAEHAQGNTKDYILSVGELSLVIALETFLRCH